MRSSRPDVICSQNNGVLAVKPTPTGKLRSLVLLVQSTRDERVWVFLDPTTFEDNNGGDLRVDHKMRGVSSGTHYDGMKFIALCRKLGLLVTYEGFFVPFSNGQRRCATDRHGQPMADYSEEELKRMRWDLPNEADLRRAIELDARSESEPEHPMTFD